MSDTKTGLVHEIRERFKSGNSVPVQRAHITAAEWAKVEELLSAASGVQTFAAAGVSAYIDNEALNRFDKALDDIIGGLL